MELTNLPRPTADETIAIPVMTKGTRQGLLSAEAKSATGLDIEKLWAECKGDLTLCMTKLGWVPSKCTSCSKGTHWELPNAHFHQVFRL